MPLNTRLNHLAESVGGRLFWTCSGKVSLAGAGNVRIHAKNPVGSGVRAFQFTFFSYNSLSVSGAAGIYLNPTTGLPVPLISSNCTRLSASGLVAGKVESRTDTDLAVPLGGGTYCGDLGVPPGRNGFYGTAFVYEPGDALGINSVYGGAADVYYEALFLEVPL